MPRGRRPTTETVISEEQLHDMFYDRTCKLHLKNIFFDLLTKDETCKPNCAICLDNIICKHSMELLNCGHYFHIDCYREQENMKCSICRN